MSEMMSSRLTEDVTTEPEIVSLTSVTGVVAIMKDVNKDASISDKFGRKDSPEAACGLMIIRFRLGLFMHGTPHHCMPLKSVGDIPISFRKKREK